MVKSNMIEIQTSAVVERYKRFEIILKHKGKNHFVVIASNSKFASIAERHYIYERVYPRGFFKFRVDDDDIRHKIGEVKAAIDTINDKEQEMYNRVKRLTGEM